MENGCGSTVLCVVVVVLTAVDCGVVCLIVVSLQSPHGLVTSCDQL